MKKASLLRIRLLKGLLYCSVKTLQQQLTALKNIAEDLTGITMYWWSFTWIRWGAFNFRSWCLSPLCVENCCVTFQRTAGRRHALSRKGKIELYKENVGYFALNCDMFLRENDLKVCLRGQSSTSILLDWKLPDKVQPEQLSSVISGKETWMWGFYCSIRKAVQTSTRIVDKLEKVNFIHEQHRSRSWRIKTIVSDFFVLSSDSSSVWEVPRTHGAGVAAGGVCTGCRDKGPLSTFTDKQVLVPIHFRSLSKTVPC